MANYKGHIAGGLIAGGAYVAAMSWAPVARYAETAGVLHDWQALAAIFVLTVLFGLFPDVDTNSKAQDIFFGIAFVVDILLILSGNLQAAAYLGLIAMFPIIGHHRGWTHKKWAMFVVPLPIVLIPYLYNEAALKIALVYYGAAVAGYFSHLLFDGLIIKKFRIKN
ncbi:MAG: metal-dependent hydrolase [Candidatus Saccharimonadales bacterium]